MNRIELLEAFCSMRSGEPVIISPALANHVIAASCDEPMTIYNMVMPGTTALALGVALGWPSKKTVAIEGDGSLLSGPGALLTIARYQPRNFVVLVCDNENYLSSSGGLVGTATAYGADIEQLGRASGLKQTTTVFEIAEARQAMERALREPGPWLIVAKVDDSDRRMARHPLPVTVFEASFRFRRAALDAIAAESA